MMSSCAHMLADYGCSLLEQQPDRGMNPVHEHALARLSKQQTTTTVVPAALH